MADVKQIITKLILLGIVMLAVMSFIVIIQSDNDVGVDDNILNNSVMNSSYGDLQTSLNQQTAAESSLDALENIPPQDYVGDLDVGSTVSAVRTAKTIMKGLWSIYIQLPIVILGVSPIVAGAITTILLIIFAIGVWAIWKGAIS